VQSGYVESFNAWLRDQLLDREIFYTLKEAQIVIESWRRHHDAVRPHASLATLDLIVSTLPRRDYAPNTIYDLLNRVGAGLLIGHLETGMER
jgi:Integrase core domain